MNLTRHNGQTITQATHFLCLQGPHDRGTRFLFRTTRLWLSGDGGPCIEDVLDGGVVLVVLLGAMSGKDRDLPGSLLIPRLYPFLQIIQRRFEVEDRSKITSSTPFELGLWRLGCDVRADGCHSSAEMECLRNVDEQRRENAQSGLRERQ